MEYNKIIAVTGLPGLYELLSSKNDGAIVRSLDDKTTRFVASRVHNFSHLESIEVYTVRENVNLVEILKAMESGGEKLPDDKDGAALKTYFSKVYPDLDFDRVYSSDLKKMVKWYTVLKNNNIEIKLSEPAPEEEEAAEEEAEEPVRAAGKKTPATEKPAAEKPAVEKHTADKHTAEKKAKKTEEEEVPVAKKAPAKKKEEEEKPAAPPKTTAAKTTAAKTTATKTSAAAKEAAAKAAPAKEKAPAAGKAAADKPKKAAKKK
jgi:Domain of unknown function (DUF5606)